MRIGLYRKNYCELLFVNVIEQNQQKCYLFWNKLLKLLNPATFNCFRQFKTDIGLADQCIEEGNSDL